jgi:prophage antirepressor-like protein
VFVNGILEKGEEMNTKKDQLVSFSPDAPMILDYDGRRVRFVGTADVGEWIAQDVCDVLDIESARHALAGFDEDERGVCTVYGTFGKRELLTVYEPGLYRLIMKSRKPEAKKFQKWIFKEVLPSIRKYGIYPPPETSAYQLSLKPYTARVVWVMQVRRRLPKGCWCVFIEGAEILIGAEHIFGPAELEMK